MSDLPARRRVVNRERELEEFQGILAERSAPCLVQLQSAKGFGKSWFLDLLEETMPEFGCAYYTRIGIKKDKDPKWLADEIRTGLGDGAVHRFSRLSMALDMEDSSAFAFPSIMNPSLDFTIADANIERSQITVNQNIDQHFTIGSWPESLRRAAERRCLEGLLADLRELSQKQLVVLLIDQFDFASNPMKSWLEDALSAQVFGETNPFGALVLTVASNKPAFPRLPHRLGNRAGSMIQTFELAEPRAWQTEEIRKFIKLAGWTDDNDVELFSKMFERNMNLKAIRGAADELADLVAA